MRTVGINTASGVVSFHAANFMRPFDFHLRARVVFGNGSVARLGTIAQELGFRRTLLVADRGLGFTGHVDRAAEALREAQVVPFVFSDFDANPDSTMVEAGRDQAVRSEVDSIVALGGGSSLDCAKGIN